MLTCYIDGRSFRDIKILIFIMCNVDIIRIFQFFVYHIQGSFKSSSKYFDWYMFLFYIISTEFAASSPLGNYTQSN
jgi:hypothetical protein